MNIEEKIETHIISLAEPKRSEIQELHERIIQTLPECKLWFFDGKNSDGKIIAHPTIGYGNYNIAYANGTSKEFFQIGMGANSSGIFVHILPLKDGNYLADTFGKELGKASVSKYCINFKTLKNINIDVLEAAILYGVQYNKK